jgi:hypothetical protein
VLLAHLNVRLYVTRYSSCTASMQMRRAAIRVFAASLLVFTPRHAAAFSALAHEAAIDVVWDTGIRPLLVRRFPSSDAPTLDRARSFAYGGSVIQDLGYYPFGSKLFTNLVHYVRSGDFVEALLRDARTIDEYAFALGALAHYANDNTGHPEATNKAVAQIFPKVGRKFGPIITYAQAPAQHVIVEFSFDVVQAAGGAYPSDAYKRFIGFRVATELLERAFQNTYGLTMNELFGDHERAIATYRYAVSQVIPALTQAAWRDKHDEIVKLLPAARRDAVVFNYTRADYEKEYGDDYQKPGLFARFLALLYRILPKVGPLKPLSFKAPTPEVERLFVDSFQLAAQRYRRALTDVADSRFDFMNTDFDTGRPARHGEYSLADDTYAELLAKLAAREPGAVPTALRTNVLAFYGPDPAPSSVNKRERKQWKDVERVLAGWRAAAR